MSTSRGAKEKDESLHDSLPEAPEALSQPLSASQDAPLVDGTNNSVSMNVQNVHGRSVVVGQLPDDFLRIGGTEDNRDQIDTDQELALALQQQCNQQAVKRQNMWASQYKALLTITFVDARLVKNYGLMNMNLYVRLRVGHTILETKTSNRGGRTPRWNETCKCYIPKGVDTISIEIYDDCLITSDELIAWTMYKIPERYLTFGQETPVHNFEESIKLTGKQGENMEGDIFIVCTTKPVTSSPMVGQTVVTTPMYRPSPYLFAGNSIMAAPIIVHQSTVPATTLLPPATQQSQQAQPVQIREEDVKSLVEMFPKIDVDVVKSVLVSERGNLDRAINSLLELNSTT